MGWHDGVYEDRPNCCSRDYECQSLIEVVPFLTAHPGILIHDIIRPHSALRSIVFSAEKRRRRLAMVCV